MSDTPVLQLAPARDGVSLDLDRLVSGRLLIQAGSGGGKSYGVRYVLEQTHGKIQQIVIDPEGEFASLRERFDYLLAGKDGDVPADVRSAKLLCRRVMELGVSVVIDIYDLKLDERREFIRVFLDALMHLPRTLWRPLIVALDEAHMYAPERGQGEATSTDAVITVCSQGRKRGFCAVLATQRISKLHKDAAAELRNKLIGLCTLDLDLKRAGDELGFDKEQRATLRELPAGHFYALGPAIGAPGVTLVRTGEVLTTHPEPGQIAPPPPPAPAAIAALVQQLQDLPAQAEEEARSLEDLQRRIRELEAELRKKPTAAAPDPRAIERAVDEATRPLNDHIRTLHTKLGRGEELADQLVAVLKNGAGPVLPPQPRTENRPSPAAPLPSPIPAPTSGPWTRPAESSPADQRRPARPAGLAAGVSGPQLTDAQKRILAGIALLHDIGVESPSRAAVGAVSGYKSTSGGSFAKNVGVLVVASLVWIPEGGLLELTRAGEEVAPESAPITRLADLHARWLGLLSEAEARILSALIAAYPESLSRPTLGERSGYTSTSGGSFAKNVGKLVEMRAAEIPKPGSVKAADILFPEGLS